MAPCRVNSESAALPSPPQLRLPIPLLLLYSRARAGRVGIRTHTISFGRFPDPLLGVPEHVVQPEYIRRLLACRVRLVIGVSPNPYPRCTRQSIRVCRTRVLSPRAGRVFPLRFGGWPSARPPTICAGLLPGDVQPGLLRLSPIARRAGRRRDFGPCRLREVLIGFHRDLGLPDPKPTAEGSRKSYDYRATPSAFAGVAASAVGNRSTW